LAAADLVVPSAAFERVVAQVSPDDVVAVSAELIRIRKVDFDKQVALWRDIPQLKGCLQIQPVPLAGD
jgi:hypothetical protein